MIIIFVELIDRLIDCPINCASLSYRPVRKLNMDLLVNKFDHFRLLIELHGVRVDFANEKITRKSFKLSTSFPTRLHVRPA